MSALYQMKKVSYAYTQQKVIQDLSLEIQKEDFIGILGANGSGKTTLLRILAGYLKLKEGSVFLEGKNLDHFSTREKARKIAVVPQSFDVLFPFTVSDMVLMGRWAHLKAMA